MLENWESQTNTYFVGYAEDAYGRSTEIHQDWPEEYDDINKAKIACVEGLGVRNYIFLQNRLNC